MFRNARNADSHSATTRAPALGAACGMFTLMALAACGGGGGSSNYGTGPTTTPTVSAHNPVQATTSLAFNPSEITISPGDSVTFVFQGVEHTVDFQRGADSAAYYANKTSDTGAPSNIPATSNASVTRVFATAGKFEYRCTIHPNMTGEIKVQ